MKLSSVQVKILTNASLAGLETDVNAFLAGQVEATYVAPVKVIIDDGTYSAIVNYTK